VKIVPRGLWPLLFMLVCLSAGAQNPYGEIVPVAEQTLLVIGRPLSLGEQADVANVVLHRSGDTLYLIDTGDTESFREHLRAAVERLRPFRRVVLINTNGHVDHIGNNDLAYALGAERVDHFISVNDVPTLRDNIRYFAESFERVAPYVDLGKSPTAYSNDLVSLFSPVAPNMETVRVLESLPLEALEIGEQIFPGWRFGEDLYVMKSHGRTAGQVVVYIPAAKLLHLSDETNSYFPPWHDSSAFNTINLLLRVREVLDGEGVKFLSDSRHHRLYDDPRAQRALVETLIANYFAFDRLVNSALSANPEGLTLDELAARFEADPALQIGSDLDVDRNPLFIRIKLLKKLTEVGAVPDGPPAPDTRFVRGLKSAS